MLRTQGPAACGRSGAACLLRPGQERPPAPSPAPGTLAFEAPSSRINRREHTQCGLNVASRAPDTGEALGTYLCKAVAGAAVTDSHQPGASDNGRRFPHGSGDQKPQVEVWARLGPSQGLDRESVPGLFPSFWWQLWPLRPLAGRCATPISAPLSHGLSSRVSLLCLQSPCPLPAKNASHWM